MLTAFMFCSCEDDDNGRKITINFFSNTTLANGSRWVFITDVNGNSLDYAQLTQEGTVVLDIPATVSDEKVTLNYFTDGGLSWSTPKDLISFADVAPGDYTIAMKRSGGLPINAQVVLENTPEDVEVSFSGQVFSMGHFDDIFALNIFPGANTEARALVTAFDKVADGARYKLFTIKANDELNIDFNTLSGFEKSEISLPGELLHVSQYGYSNEVEYLIRGKYFYPPDAGPTLVPLYHAPGFDSYLTSIRVYLGNESFSNMVSGPNVPSSFVKLDANVEVKNNDASGFDLTFTGDADVTQVVFTHETGNRWGPPTINTRTYHLPAGSSLSFHHPIIPPEILEAIGAEEYPIGAIDRIALAQYDAFSSYDEYIQYRLIEGNDFFSEVKSGSKWRAKGF